MKSRRVWWLIFGACAIAVVAGMMWITVEMLRLERSERAARQDAARQEAVRLALWRMDSWFAPRLGREAARQYFDYRPFYPQQRAYTKLLNRIEPGEVLTPSPLLSFESDYIRLHFQLWPDGSFTSPQAPTGNARDLAEDTFLSGERINSNLVTLNDVCNVVTPETLVSCVALPAPTSRVVPLLVPDPVPADAVAQGQTASQEVRTQVEWVKRQQAYVQNTLDPEALARVISGSDPAGDSGVDVGPLVPLWAGSKRGGRAEAEQPADAGESVSVPSPANPIDVATGELMFVRGVRVQDEQYIQGFLCDWPRLCDSLLAEIEDLLPGAVLVPVRSMGTAGVAGVRAEDGEMLATVPARLVVPVALPPTISAWSPARVTLGVTWLAVLATLGAVAITLRASIAFGDKRSRFASAVTHELRTPLTTFRMYSEMLAEGMVTDPETRQTYLNTLKSESDRLAALVENVLSYARLERGRAQIERKPTTLGALIESVLPGLERRAAGAGMDLVVQLDGNPESPLHIDVEAVRQILHNLVDNACKYAADGETRSIEVAARLERGKLLVAVRDHGPGIAGQHARAIFTPFERGSREPGDTTPGVGLGLALARGLARRLGGDLCLDATCGPSSSSGSTSGSSPGASAGSPAGRRAHDSSPARSGCGACFRLSVPTGI